jgi:hypothetical protein
MSDITDFISAAVNEKPVAAQKAFAQAMEPKIDAAIQAKYSEIAQSIFNPQEEEMIEVEDAIDQELETEMEDPNDVETNY